MASDEVVIVLTKQKRVNGFLRDPGFVLAEVIMPDAVTCEDLDTSLSLGMAKAVKKQVKPAPPVRQVARAKD